MSDQSGIDVSASWLRFQSRGPLALLAILCLPGCSAADPVPIAPGFEPILEADLFDSASRSITSTRHRLLRSETRDDPAAQQMERKIRAHFADELIGIPSSAGIALPVLVCRRTLCEVQAIAPLGAQGKQGYLDTFVERMDVSLVEIEDPSSISFKLPDGRIGYAALFVWQQQ